MLERFNIVLKHTGNRCTVLCGIHLQKSFILYRHGKIEGGLLRAVFSRLLIHNKDTSLCCYAHIINCAYNYTMLASPFSIPQNAKKRPASEEAERLVTSFYSSISIPQVRVKVIRSFAWTVMLSTSAAH